MRFWLKSLLVAVSLLIAGHSGYSLAEDVPFAQYKLEPDTDDIHLILNGQIEYEFSRAALEALDNGLPLVLLTEVELLLPREWFWDHKVWSQSYEHSIEYHALSQQYLVKDILADYQRAYLTRSSALEALGQFDHLALLELDALDSDQTYIVRIRSGLSSDALPVPLRPLTFLSDKWKLTGDWLSLFWRKEEKHG